MENTIHAFYLEPKHFDKWAHQNQIEYTGDFVEGVLLDNFVVFTKHGIAALYAHYLNPWQSNYIVEFVREDKNNSEWTQKIMERWYKFEETNRRSMD